MAYKVLQIADYDWSALYPMPVELDWVHLSAQALKTNQMTLLQQLGESAQYDLVLLDIRQQVYDVLVLADWLPNRRLIYSTACFPLISQVQELFDQKQAIRQDFGQPELVLRDILGLLQSRRRFERYIEVSGLVVVPRFLAATTFLGQYTLEVTAAFGDDYQKLAFSSHYQAIPDNHLVELWPEFAKTPGIDLAFEISVLSSEEMGGTLLQKEVIQGADLERPYVIGPYSQNVLLNVSVYVKGQGTLELRRIGMRSSKSSYGRILMGDHRLLDNYRGEVAYYFYPGDRSQELTVWFSNGQELATYEGLDLAQGRHKPFLLFKDLRGQDGQFYLGNPDFQEAIVSVMKQFQEQLEAPSERVFVLGNALASLPALYYGLQIKASAIFVANPLLFLTDIVQDNSRYNAGGELDIMDLVQKAGRELTLEAVVELEESVWQVLQGSAYFETRIFLAYLALDDYEQDLYQQVVSALSEDREASMTLKVFNHFSRDAKESMQDWLYGNYITQVEG